MRTVDNVALLGCDSFSSSIDDVDQVSNSETCRDGAGVICVASNDCGHGCARDFSCTHLTCRTRSRFGADGHGCGSSAADDSEANGGSVGGVAEGSSSRRKDNYIFQDIHPFMSTRVMEQKSNQIEIQKNGTNNKNENSNTLRCKQQSFGAFEGRKLQKGGKAGHQNCPSVLVSGAGLNFTFLRMH